MQRVSITFPYLLLLVMSLPAVSFLAFAALERALPAAGMPPEASGGHRYSRWLRLYTGRGSRLLRSRGRHAVRCLHRAQLFHQGEPCLVIVSGGRVDQNQAGHTVAAAIKTS